MNVAIWMRVSSESQETENQAIALREWAARRGLEVTREYRVEASAWHGAQHPALREAMNDAHLGHFDVLLCWSIDRVSRGGVEETLGILRRLRESGVSVESLQENWITGSPEMAELMTSILAWVARMESQRRSERVRAGLARRKAEGKPIGRIPGAVDLKPRRRSGYVARYEH
jgi:putative DNA-invertase from lambdoid prophage Rac